MTQKIKMVVTDLDGTLHNDKNKLSDTDFFTLKELNQRKIIRVVATGRSLFSFEKVCMPDFPIDFLIFSSGCGIYDWNNKNLISENHIPKQSVLLIANELKSQNLSFMIHSNIPENHKFCYYIGNDNKNSDFYNRIKLYDGHTKEIGDDFKEIGDACQFVAITEEIPQILSKVERYLSQFKVVRTTSPLDGKSMWIEIFPKKVSKGDAVLNLCKKLEFSTDFVLGIGNDYNDIDLLKTTGYSFVVENAPAVLKEKYIVTSSNNNSGFSEAVKHFFDL
ncbi:MAG: HAD family phosphatase [Bacteroidetes bacterium]|jgi:Cof subfamily protein (haloacid dehalogenase superfamily)|nr:HAD family phosphatase [Bacteroidota bacterium]MBT6685705.1 HAD family phosphatase [Bacteroidota bacterium]MBT7143500.1 HAD family phosphatase [Bacteroidota bacterium]MBT7492225.1 HAD family phosphatase [Bacteroidota bacterium]